MEVAIAHIVKELTATELFILKWLIPRKVNFLSIGNKGPSG